MAQIVENALVVYTDGSLYPKGRRGGYGLVAIHIDDIGRETIIDQHAPPGVRGTTGNRMELQACIDALKIAPQQNCFCDVQQLVLRTDSQYVASNYLSALGYWRKNKWRDASGRPIENVDLWKKFVRAFQKRGKPVRIEKVKGHGRGHQKDPYNDRADKLAKESAKNPLSQYEFRSSVRRKIAPASTKRGSVTIAGQELVIYIVETKRMREHGEWQYRYQVASKESRDCGALDWIYSEEFMKDGHYYHVRVNSDMEYPKVLEVLREVNGDELGDG